MRIRTWLVPCLSLLAWLGGSTTPLAATLPTGFSDPIVVSGLSVPTAFVFAPDGRIFITEKGGTVRIVQNGSLLPAPMLSVAVDSGSERGLLGIALDPSFASNGRFFVYYTTSASSFQPPGHAYAGPKNRVSRFTLSGNTANAASQTVIVDDIASDAGNHNAGWIQFGPGGKLYVSTGDGGQFSANSQSLSNLSGKILRLNADGSIPSDNPYVGIAGRRAEIWCYGLRNPWRFTFDPAGRLFIGDVGGGGFEEINVGGAGLNFGWPVVEGPDPNPAYVRPIYSYPHAAGSTAITAGAFSTSDRYPGVHHRALFFGDYGTGAMRTLQYNPATPTSPSADLSADAGTPVHFAQGPDGWMYYLTIFPGVLRRIEYERPSITAFGSNPVSQVPVGTPVTWTVQANGVAPLEYQFWRYATATGTWSIAQPYGTSSSHTWTPTSSEGGTYIVQVWVRYVGTTHDWEDWRASAPLTVTTPARLTSFSSNTAFPVAAGTTVTWTAQATGGTGAREYVFWRYNATLQSWTMVQPYGPANTFTWTPGPRDGGLHVLQVWVRSQGSGVSYEDWRGTDYLEVTTASPALLDVVSTRTDVVAPGASVTWTGRAAGGTAPLLYQFWRQRESDGTWTIAQAFSTSSAYTWTPGLADRGPHHVQVWVKSSGAPSFEDWRNGETVSVTNIGTPSLTSDASGSPGAGTTITWTATATGSPAPLQYRFWRFDVNAGTWTLARDYSTDPTHAWVAAAGSYVIQMWVRSNGSPASYERWAASGILTVHP